MNVLNMVVAAVTTLLVVVVTALYWYYKRKFSYWKNVGVASVPTVPVFGSMLALITDIWQNVEMEWYKKYGRIYGFYEGTKPNLSVAEPEIIKNVLLKDFNYFVSRRELNTGDEHVDNMLSVLNGEKWKRVRTIVTPAFTTGKIRKMTSLILDSVKVLSQHLDTAAKSKIPVDAKKSMSCFSMDVIASTAFGTKVDSNNDSSNEFVVQARKIFGQNAKYMFLLFFFFPKIGVLLQKILRLDDPMTFFKDATHQIIKERKTNKKEYNDFLQLLMDAKDETQADDVKKMNGDHAQDTGANEKEMSEKITRPPGTKKSLSEGELLAQCILFFIAGFDTTSSTLALTCYELALNPSIQEKLIEEIDNAVKENGNEVTYEAIQNMKYMDQVISETLRLYPPVIRIERTATDDYNLGLQDIKIPKGMMVSIPVYAMHHDPEFFPDPEKFDPSRFDADEKAKRSPYVYLPFGAGPRNCIGMRFVLMKMKVCLAYILSLYRLKKSSETKIPEFFSGSGLLIPKEVMVGVEVREDRVLKDEIKTEQ